MREIRIARCLISWHFRGFLWNGVHGRSWPFIASDRGEVSRALPTLYIVDPINKTHRIFRLSRGPVSRARHTRRNILRGQNFALGYDTVDTELSDDNG